MQHIQLPLFCVREGQIVEQGLLGLGRSNSSTRVPVSATRESKFTQGHPVTYMINLNPRRRALEKLFRLALLHQVRKETSNCGKLGVKHK